MGNGKQLLALPPSAGPPFLEGESTFPDISSQKQLDEETRTSQSTLDGSDYQMLSILSSIDSDILEDLFSPAENGYSTGLSGICSDILESLKWPLSCDTQTLKDTADVKEAVGPEKTELISRKRREQNVQGRFEETRVTRKTGLELLVSNGANEEQDDLQDLAKRHGCTHQSTDEGWKEPFHIQNVENVEPGATASIMQHGHSWNGGSGIVNKDEKESTSAEPEIAASRMITRDAHCNGTNAIVNIKEKENIPPAAVQTECFKSLPHIVLSLKCQPQGFYQPTLAAERRAVVDEDGWVCPRASKKRRHRVKQGLLDGWLKGFSPT